MSCVVLKRAGNKILIATAAALLVVSGCDNDQNKADRETRAGLTEAQAKIAQGAADGATPQLTQAAGNAAASAALRASAKGALAQSELEAGQKLVAVVDRNEMDLARVAFEIGQLAGQIRTSGTEVAASRLYDPKPAKDAIAAAIAEAQGGPDKPAWFTQGSSVLPTLAAAKDQVAKLQADLTAKQDQVKSMTKQRGVLLDQADQASVQADQAKPGQALDIFKRSSEMRRQAGEISVQLDVLQNEISKVQNNLSIAQTQQAAVSDAISQLQDQVTTLDKTWREVDGKATEHQKIAADILGSPGTALPPEKTSAGGSISQKAAEWDRLAKEIRTARRDAEVQLASAAQHFDEARKAAEELQRKISEDSTGATPTQLAAWQNTKQVMDAAQFRLQAANAQRALGELHMSEAGSAASRIAVIASLRGALEGASLRLPSELAGSDLNTERSNALKSADAAFKEADDGLNDIINGRSDLKGIDITAKIARALELYDWAQVARMSGNEPLAKQHIKEAIAIRNEAAEAGAMIPTMPPELGQPPKRAAEGEQADATTQPATAPAAQ